jgi:glyoxylase-like metal-dependent hydrolase (beta-lactamase superfamily II)
VQIYLVTTDPLTLIDTGVKSPASRAALESAFESLGVGLDEVQRVVLTHWHTDHMGQVQTLRDAGADLELWVHEADVPHVENFSATFEENAEATIALFREHGVPETPLQLQAEWRRSLLRGQPTLCESTPVDEVLHGGERIPFKGFELEVIHAPGHTAGHILLHEPSSGTLLTGDHIMGSAVPFTDHFYLGEAPDPSDALQRRPRFRGLAAYLDSLRRLRRGGYRTLLPAHGGVIERPARAIEEASLFYEVRIQRVERALTQGLEQPRALSAWEIWQALFPKADPVTQLRTRMLMVIGALDVLEQDAGVVVERRADGVLAYVRR